MILDCPGTDFHHNQTAFYFFLFKEIRACLLLNLLFICFKCRRQHVFDEFNEKSEVTFFIHQNRAINITLNQVNV